MRTIAKNKAFKNGKHSALRQIKIEKSKHSARTPRKIRRALSNRIAFRFLQVFAKDVKHADVKYLVLRNYYSGDDFLFEWAVCGRAATESTL